MPQMDLAKYLRSSLLVNPASCETLLSRTSTSLFTPVSLSRVKNVSADFFVKPMVKIFISPPSGKSVVHPGQVRVSIRTLYAFPDANRFRPSIRPGSDQVHP